MDPSDLETLGRRIEARRDFEVAQAEGTLLDDAACPLNETCAVVKPSDGTTSCVPVGLKLVGQECETDHCAADLVCLGPLGSRTCYQLCETSAPSVCQTAQTCVGSAPEFQDPSVGICQ